MQSLSAARPRTRAANSGTSSQEGPGRAVRAGLTIPSSRGLQSGAFTIEGWVKIALAPAATKVAFGFDSLAWVGVLSSGLATSQVGGSTWKETLTGTTNIADGAWHHLALT